MIETKRTQAEAEAKEREPEPRPMTDKQFNKAVDVLRFNKPPRSEGEDQDVARIRVAIGQIIRSWYPNLPQNHVASPSEAATVCLAR